MDFGLLEIAQSVVLNAIFLLFSVLLSVLLIINLVC